MTARKIWKRTDKIGSISKITSIEISEEGNIYTASQKINIKEPGNFTTSYYLVKYASEEKP